VRDFLMTSDMTPAELCAIVELAASVKAEPAAVAGRLAGYKIGLFFQKPSTRTRVSCEVAVVDLGAHAVTLRDEEVGLGTREAPEDVARVLDRYLDVIALRVYDHADLETMAASANAAVINLLSDLSHPVQALADLQTIAEARTLKGTLLAYVGDGNNVCHSLLLGGALTGMHVHVAVPAAFGPRGDIVARAVEIAADTGGSITISNDVPGAVAGADVVYTDVWTSMGHESESSVRAAAFEGYRIDDDLFATAASDAIFLHCLPAHRGEEVTDGVMDHERSRVFDQAENRAHAFKALLLHLTGTA
jgi:ornithine carbamoyltransferase